ncbi:hypothetical protein [Anaeropeptidivorans aminofermentans]|uniref:hypothetical protein n=1 Tax=Anaeropeptidivorans aminofermentans TaxID=2934315 RepID=UPI002025601F|nr:hypothetical protein [Anaeropeptidivorans aminofermentans]MBE6011398.1 hypothetical protein [Lachnospiraceae bacterium]
MIFTNKKDLCKSIRKFIKDISYVDVEDYEISLFTCSLGLKVYDVIELFYKIEDEYHIPVRKFYQADKKLITIASLAEGIIEAMSFENIYV